MRKIIQILRGEGDALTVLCDDGTIFDVTKLDLDNNVARSAWKTLVLPQDCQIEDLKVEPIELQENAKEITFNEINDALYAHVMWLQGRADRKRLLTGRPDGEGDALAKAIMLNIAIILSDEEVTF